MSFVQYSQFVPASRHLPRDKLVLDKLFDTLKTDQIPDLKFPSYDNAVPLLYPTLNADAQAKPLQQLATSLININIVNHNTKLFKRSQDDINNYDFNYFNKIKGSNDIALIDRNLRTLSVPNILQQFIIRHKLQGIANIPLVESKLPNRIRNTLDNKCLLTILGLIFKDNTSLLGNIIINDHILNLKNRSQEC